MTGKIIKGIAGFYYVHDGLGCVYACRAKGIFRNKKIKPLVGDDVDFSVLSQEEAEGNINEILPRKNMLIRPAVSNVDQALVVFSVCHPAPNCNLLDRFLVAMEQQKVPVVICFNKVDLCTEAEAERLRCVYENPGYPVILTSARDRRGLEEVRSVMRGKTTVLAGPSGVGKSSLTNQIHPAAAMETGQISRKIERGKHTTRHSELFWVEEGTFMMDTPGFSSMFVEGMQAKDLKDYFPEFASWEHECRFLGCAHMEEPVCGVKKAVENNQISTERYENYRLIYEELKQKKKY